MKVYKIRKPMTDMIESVKQVAENAKANADEAKTLAEQAGTSVNEYMDALLGLNTTNETEATDAE